MEYFSNMELFRTHPCLCSLFLVCLEDWGAGRVDWKLLNNEEFVDLFLRKLCLCEDVEQDALLKGCSLLLQPSPGGLLAAAALHQAGVLVGEEFAEFTTFTLRGSGNGWKPLCWGGLSEVLEEVAFSSDSHDAAWNLASLMSRGWIAREHQARFFKRVWQTCRLSLGQKKEFFRWLYGQHQWSGLPKAPSTYPEETFSLKVAYRLSSARRPYSSRREGFKRRTQQAR